MIGYWNQPESTAAALAGGVLHTGDIGRLDADGYLYIVDRQSEMIVRGGYNVYPAEVERVIRAVPGVADCVLVAIPDERMGEVPVALVEPAEPVTPAGSRGASGVDVNAILEACRAQLARYKVPQDVLVVPELPRTAMQKVDRAAARRRVTAGREPAIEGK
jgi:acyl-CoA synthetase (AMP-forming)/AMP-acid ligase II